MKHTDRNGRTRLRSEASIVVEQDSSLAMAQSACTKQNESLVYFSPRVLLDIVFDPWEVIVCTAICVFNGADHISILVF
jgi:hypothetical protein